MNSKILSICIPTYMRSAKLKKCIESIVKQFDNEVINKVDLLIFDNCSQDDTSVICNQYIHKYNNIKYIRNENNIGPDKNFLKILSFKLNSKFCHLMADDDMYCEKSLKDLIHFLEKYNDLDFVYVNIIYFVEDILNNSIEHKKLYNGKELLPYLSKKKFVKCVNNEISFLSGMIFNTKTINLNNSNDFVGTNWLQSYMLFNSTIKSEKKLAFYSKVVVAKRDLLYEPDYDRFKVFGRNYYNLLKYGYEVCGYSKKQLIKLLISRYLKLIYWAKCNNIDKNRYKDIINISKENKYIKVLLFNCVPSFVCKFYYKIKHKRSN